MQRLSRLFFSLSLSLKGERTQKADRIQGKTFHDFQILLFFLLIIFVNTYIFQMDDENDDDEYVLFVCVCVFV